MSRKINFSLARFAVFAYRRDTVIVGGAAINTAISCTGNMNIDEIT
jgi:hypothetical protein